MALNRREPITGLAAAPVAAAPGTAAPALPATDTYPSNTALYSDPALVEGVDYGRRCRRHPIDDQDPAGRAPFVRTTVIAPHGGGIEEGTSELCLAIAGYHPAGLAPHPAAGPVHDFWLFEGLRATGNAALHVTATHCDDTMARSLAAGSLNVVAVHGCSAARAGMEPGARAVLVGGLNPAFRQYLVEEFTAAGICAVSATGQEGIAGIAPDNICNRTLLGTGAQLEVTADLRAEMFAAGRNTPARRAESTLPLFWSFVAAARAAIARVEAEQHLL
ncbi:poly-gamma-glutamate hydrolase family protein [Kitasatospora sp. NBC_00374]|uniref:poly-gamma-glutamate hydrolase family protein n=1 Tax=Kitasatospora sp. NBC_00374 TaxID=2975964 RepID=UPI00324F3D1A